MSDHTGWYLQSIGRVPLLTAAQEIELGRQVKLWMELRELPKEELTPLQKRQIRSGERAYKKMYEANLRLVVNLARKYRTVAKSLDFLDLIQEGNIGLARAIELFDYSRGYKFSTYAYWWIRQSISRGIAQLDSTIRIPSGQVDRLSKIKTYTQQILGEKGRLPTKAEICEHFEMDPRDLDHLLATKQGCRSLNTATCDDGSELLDIIPAELPTAEEVLEDANKQHIIGELKAYVPSLNQTQQEVIQRSFFSEYHAEGESLASIAKDMGISRDTARQHKNKAIRRLMVKARFAELAA